MKLKKIIEKVLFYSGLLIFVAILKINYLAGVLGGIFYILMWHFIFDRIFNEKQKEIKDLSKHDLFQVSSQAKSKSVEQDNKKQKINMPSLKRLSVVSIVSFILILISAGVFIYSCSKYYSSPSVEAVGELIGIVILSLVIVFIVERLIKRKRLAILIFALAFTVIAGFNSYNKIQESKTINKSVQETLSSSFGKTQKNYSEKEYGEFAPFLTILNNYQKQMNDLFSNMENEMDSQDIDNVLSQQILSSPHNIQDALLRLNNTQKIIDKYKALYKNKMDKLTEDVSKVDISPDLKQSFTKGYTEGFQESTAIVDEMLDTEKEFVITTKELLNFLLEKQGKYEFQNDQIAFYNDSDINQYNNFVKKINSLAQKEQSLFISYQQKFEEAKDKIKKDLVK